MENRKEICICPECFSLVKKKSDDAVLRNKNNERIYFCNKECKERYLENQRRLKNLKLL